MASPANAGAPLREVGKRMPVLQAEAVLLPLALLLLVGGGVFGYLCRSTYPGEGNAVEAVMLGGMAGLVVLVYGGMVLAAAAGVVQHLRKARRSRSGTPG